MSTFDDALDRWVREDLQRDSVLGARVRAAVDGARAGAETEFVGNAYRLVVGPSGVTVQGLFDETHEVGSLEELLERVRPGAP